MGLGTFRYVLACIVLASHLWLKMPHGFAAYAVWAFFTLSGFLMTFVLNEKYGFSFKGILKYFFNRALRIYPLYWISFVLGIGVILLVRSFEINPTILNIEFGMPILFSDWIKNLFLYIDYYYTNPVPVANALRIEVAYYFLMPLLARKKTYAWLALAISMAFNLYWLFISYYNHVDTFSIRYATFLPCGLSFSVGSLLYHYRYFLNKFESPKLSIACWIFNGLLWYKFPNYPWGIGLYISLIFSSWLIISLYNIKSNYWDQWLGELSYPVYLLHTSIGTLLLILFGADKGFLFMLVTWLFVQLISLGLLILIDKPLKRIKL